MEMYIYTLLCIVLTPNIYVECEGRGKQREIDDAHFIMTAVYDPAWTGKPSDWDWRASFEREWVSDQQTFLQARGLTTPAHLRKFKYFSPDYYKPDMSKFNTARFTEKPVTYPTYPTLPPGYSHTYLLFEDIVGPNPYNWSNETMDYANNREKYEDLYKKQQDELTGKRNKTVLKHLYKEWLKIDPLRVEIKAEARPKRNVEDDEVIKGDRTRRHVTNDEMETEEKRMFAEYEQLHINVSKFMYEEQCRTTTEGVVIKEDRPKRHVTNDEMETEEKRMFAEYEQLHINVSKFMYEEQCRTTTEGVVIKEDRPKRHVTNDEMETEEKRMFAEYEQLHINVSKFMYEEQCRTTTEGVVIKEDRPKRDIRENAEKQGSSEHEQHHEKKNDIDLCAEYVAFDKELNKYVKIKEFEKTRRMLESEEKKKSSGDKLKDNISTCKTVLKPDTSNPETVIKEERPKRHVTNDEMETEEKRMFAEYEQLRINVSKFMYEEQCRTTTEGVVIKENRPKRHIREDAEKRGSLEHKEHDSHKKKIKQKNNIDLCAEYIEFEKDLNKYVKQKGSKKAREMLESMEKKNALRDKHKEHVTTDKTIVKPDPLSPETDIFDDLGTLEEEHEQVMHWNNTILDDLGSNWEGTTAAKRIDWKAMRDERNRNTKHVDFQNLSWHEINEKWGLPLYATESPPLNESLTKIVDTENFIPLYDVVFPGRIRLLDNITVAPMFTNAPGDTPLPEHKRKTVPLDQYDDFYNMMFKDHFKKHFTLGPIQIVPRMNYTDPPTLSTRMVNNDEFFQWYDQEFTFAHRNLEQYTVHPMFMDDIGTPCPANQTKIVDPHKFEEEYDVLFGHRKRYVDLTPNKAWNDLEAIGAQTTEPWWTFYNSAYADIQERKRTVVDTNEVIEKAINMPEHDPDSEFEEKEKAFEKELENIDKKILEEHPHVANLTIVKDGLKNHDGDKSRIKRHVRQVDMNPLNLLEQLAKAKKLRNNQNRLGVINSKGTVSKDRSFLKKNVSLDASNSIRQDAPSHQQDQNRIKININVQNIIGTVRPQKHRIVKREERTSIHLFEYLKWAEAKRKRRYTTKRHRPIMFDTNDSYIIFKNYMGRVTDGDISDFDYANAVYGEYIDRYLTAQFDMFKRMYTRYSTPFQRPTWTRRTGYTDSFGRNFTFDPNYTYTTPWEEIDVIQFISECRARRKTTTHPTPKDLCPFTGTRPPMTRMTKYLDPKWLVEFGLMTTSNITTERTTSMYLRNWLKYKQKEKVSTSTLTSIYLKNFLKRRNRTGVKQKETTNLNDIDNFWKTLRTTTTQDIRKTTSIFYRNFVMRQNKLRNHSNILRKYNHSLRIAKPTNAITYLPEFLYHTSGFVKNFLNRYGSFAKEHMEKGFLRQRILSQKPNIDYCFQRQIKNISDHIDRVDKELKGKREFRYKNSIKSNEEKYNKEKQNITKGIGGPEYHYDSYDTSSYNKKPNRKKRALTDDLSHTMKAKTVFSSTKYWYYKKPTTKNASLEGTNLTKTTSIFMRNFMARINLTSPKRRRFKISKRTSLAARLLNLTTNYFPWDYFGNRTVQHILMHYYTGSENFTFPPIYSYTEGPRNYTWSIELEEDPFFRLRRRFIGKTKRRLTRTRSIPKAKKKTFEDMFNDWRNAPLRPGLPSEMLSVQSKQLEDHVAFLSTMHYVKTYTDKITVMEKILKEESYSDYEKYQRPKLRTQHSMDFDNVVKYRLYKADKLRRNRIGTVDSDYIIESVQSFMDDDRRRSTFTFPMGNFKTLYPRYNPFYYNRSVINTDLFVNVLKSLTRHPGTMAQFEKEYRKNMTERMQKYLKENPDKKEDELQFEDFEDTNEVVNQMYYMGMTTMLPEDLPHKNFDYLRNEYTAIDHAVFHWSIIDKKINRINTIPYEPGQSSTTSYLDYYWKTPSTLDWQKYWKYPYTTNVTTKPTGPDPLENREYAKNLEQNLDPEQREKILADLEQLGELIDLTSTTARTILWDRRGEEQNIYKGSRAFSNRTSERVTTRVKSMEKTVDIGDIIDPADISRELRKRKKRNLEDNSLSQGRSEEKIVCITAKPIEWKIPDSVIENIRGKTPADDIHNTKIAFKYLENCTDSEEYLKITMPNYMKDMYYRFTKYTTTTTPIIRWTMPKSVLSMIENGTNPIRLEAEKHVPYNIMRRKIMHMFNLKMKSYGIPLYRQRKDQTPFSLNTEEKDEIYYDTEERECIRHRATHNYRMATYMFPLFSNSCERMIKDMVEGYHNVYDPPAVKRIFMKNQTNTMKPGDYDGEWVKLNPNDLLRFPEPTIYWPTINRNDATYRPPWIKNSTRTTKQRRTTTPFDTESFDSEDSLVRDDWLFTTQHWNDINNANITAIQIFMDRPKGQSSEFNDYCRKHGLPLDENGNPPPDWYDSNVPSSAENFWNEIKEHNTYAPFSYSDEQKGTVEEYVKKKDMDKCIQQMMNNETINLAEEDFNETSTLVIKSRAYLSKRFSRERYHRYDAQYLKTLKEMNAPRKVKPGYKDPEYKRIEKLYEGNKNNKSNIFLSNIYKDGIKPGHELLRSEEEEINQPLSWEYNPNYTAVQSDTIDPLENPFLDPVTTTSYNPYTLVDLSDLLQPSGEESSETSTLADIPLQFVDNMVAQNKGDHRKSFVDSNIFPATTINAYTCEFVTDLMSSYELRKKNIPKDAIVAHPYGRPQPYYKKVIYDRLGRYIGTTFVSLEKNL